MPDCVDDVWADVLHYYGCDIWQMDGPAAMKLAWRLVDIVDINPNLDPPRYRSSVFANFGISEPASAAADTVDVDDLDDTVITRLDLGDAIELVVVDDTAEPGTGTDHT